MTDVAIDIPQPEEVVLLRGDALTPEPINWLWPGWLAAGKMHILGGQAGTGKTTLALALAATLTAGGRWPDGSRSPRADVVIWSGEDDPTDTLMPRLLAMGADMRRVHFVAGMTADGKRRVFDPASDMEALAAALRALGTVRLLIVDPIVSAISTDSHKNSETRRGLQPLVDLAASIKCTLVGITHFSKGTQGREPIDRITGSLAFAAVARVVMVAAKDTEQDRRILCRAKSNIGPDDGGFAYELRQDELAAYPGVCASSVLWGEAIEGSAREILGAAESQPEEGGALSKAQDWLREFLAEGPQPQREVMSAADAFCHSRKTLRRAKDAIGIESRKMGGDFGGRGAKWFWCLPGETRNPPETHKMPKNPQGAQHWELGTLCKDGHLVADDAITDDLEGIEL